MECEQDKLVGPYHDEELSVDERLAFERHLEGCGQCAAHLADLRRFSTLIASFPLEEIRPDEQRRLEAVADRLEAGLGGERAVLRMAIPLAALAAALFLATSITLLVNARSATATADAAGTQPIQSQAWPKVAVALQGDSRLPGWMVRELGGDTP